MQSSSAVHRCDCCWLKRLASKFIPGQWLKPLIFRAYEAAAIDEELMSPEGCGFLLLQLMELAGLACASAVFKAYPPDVCPNLLVAAGPGNQGGDGLVAARHAKLWGYNVQVWYPKQGKTEVFQVSH